MNIAAILARAKAATPPPWSAAKDSILAPAHPAGLIAASSSRADAVFIAAAREDIPALCTELEMCRKERQIDPEQVSRLEAEVARLTAIAGMAERVSARAEAMCSAIERVRDEVKDDPLWKKRIEKALGDAYTAGR